MDIAVPSRFACLKIEDDDFRPNAQNKKKPIKDQGKNTSTTVKETSKNSLATSSKKGVSDEKIKKKQKHKQRLEQEKDWEAWQRKDTEILNDAFEQQMQNAILQSKLEFEQQKTRKPEPQQNQGKKKKGKTMSWEQFVENKPEVKVDVKIKDTDKDFFNQLAVNTKKEITKDVVEENRKKRQEKFEEVVSLAQLQEELANEKKKNIALEHKVAKLQEDNEDIRSRNTALCGLLSKGEMKDKLQALKDLERLTSDKEELTMEVAKLHALLEQERSNKQSSSFSDSHAKHSKDKLLKKRKNK